MKHLAWLWLLMFPVWAFASGGNCGLETDLVPDGRIADQDSIAAGATNVFLVKQTVGHSYSVEMHQTYEQRTAGLSLIVLSSADTCPGGPSTIPGLTNTGTTEPANFGNFSLQRFSWTAPDSNFVRVGVKNTDGIAHSYSMAASETTVYNPNWSTFGTFVTQYNFQNTTSATITGTLTVTPTVGPSLTPVVVTVSLPPHGQLGKTAGPGGDANIAMNSAGYAIFIHNGPPGGVLTQAQFLNGSATVIVPTKFEVIRESVH